MYNRIESQYQGVVKLLDHYEKAEQRLSARMIYIVAAEALSLFAAVYHAAYLIVKVVPSTGKWIVSRIVPDLDLHNTLWLEHGKPFIFALTIFAVAIPASCIKTFNTSTILTHQLDWLSGRLPVPPKDYAKIFRKHLRIAASWAPTVIIAAVFARNVYKIAYDLGYRMPNLLALLPWSNACWSGTAARLTDGAGNSICSEQAGENLRKKEACEAFIPECGDHQNIWKSDTRSSTYAGSCNVAPCENYKAEDNCKRAIQSGLKRRWEQPTDHESVGHCRWYW